MKNGGFLWKKGHFFEKKAPKTSPSPNSISFLSVFYKKALNNFCRRGKGSIVKYNIGLEYALPNLDDLLFGL